MSFYNPHRNRRIAIVLILAGIAFLALCVLILGPPSPVGVVSW